MTISLKPELQKFIEGKVKDGRFASEQDVIEAALAHFMFDEEINELDEEDISVIDEAEAEYARGEYLDWKKVSSELRRKYLGQ